MIIDSIDNLTLNQYSYLDLLNELEVCKTKALIKLKKEGWPVTVVKKIFEKIFKKVLTNFLNMV